MQQLLMVFSLFFALWGVADIIRRLVLWITVEKHCNHHLAVTIGPQDDGWFVIRALKERAALCGLKSKRELIAIGVSLTEEKAAQIREMCEKHGILFCLIEDIELFTNNLYNS